jgi:hypothetical protein
MEDVALPVLEETLFPSPRTLLAGLGLEDLDDLRERVAPIGVDWIEIAIDREDDFSDWDDPLEVDFYLESNGTDGEAAVEQLEVVSRHSGVVARAWVGFPNSLSEVRRMVKALSEATSSVALSERGAHWITCLVDEGDAVEELESFLESGVVDASRRLVSVESESDVGLGVPGLRLEVGGWPGAVVVSVPFPINLDNLHAWMSRRASLVRQHDGRRARPGRTSAPPLNPEEPRGPRCRSARSGCGSEEARHSPRASGRAGQPPFGVDPLEVPLDGADAQGQLVGDGGVVAPLRDEPENVQLTSGQAGDIDA